MRGPAAQTRLGGATVPPPTWAPRSARVSTGRGLPPAAQVGGPATAAPPHTLAPHLGHLPPLHCLLRHPHSPLCWVSPSAVSVQTSPCTQHWFVPKNAAETCHSWREGQLAGTQRIFHPNLRVPLLQCISPPGGFQAMLTPWCFGSCEALLEWVAIPFSRGSS